MQGGGVSGAQRPTHVRPPGYDAWADTGDTNLVKLEQVLEDDQRVEDYKPETEMLEVVQNMFRPVPLPPRVELGAKYARKLAWREHIDLMLITATRFLDPSSEGALTLSHAGMDQDARIRALVALLKEHDMSSLLRFKPEQIKTLVTSDDEGLPNPPVRCSTTSKMTMIGDSFLQQYSKGGNKRKVDEVMREYGLDVECICLAGGGLNQICLEVIDWLGTHTSTEGAGDIMPMSDAHFLFVHWYGNELVGPNQQAITFLDTKTEK